MGTSDLAERALYQGLIKLAAGYVHAVRGNPIGFARNLQGARGHLQTSLRLDATAAAAADIDPQALLSEVDALLAAVPEAAAKVASTRGLLIDQLPDPPRIR
jgi:hypothetical protein